MGFCYILNPPRILSQHMSDEAIIAQLNSKSSYELVCGMCRLTRDSAARIHKLWVWMKTHAKD